MIDPFLTLSIGAVGNGLFVLKRLASDVERGEHLTRSPSQKVAASIGLARHDGSDAVASRGLSTRSTGSRSTNVVPASPPDLTLTSPPCSRAISRTM